MSDKDKPKTEPRQPTDFYGNPTYETPHPGRDLPLRPIGAVTEVADRRDPDKSDTVSKDPGSSGQSFYVHDGVGPAQLRDADPDAAETAPDRPKPPRNP